MSKIVILIIRQDSIKWTSGNEFIESICVIFTFDLKISLKSNFENHSSHVQNLGTALFLMTFPVIPIFVISTL